MSSTPTSYEHFTRPTQTLAIVDGTQTLSQGSVVVYYSPDPNNPKAPWPEFTQTTIWSDAPPAITATSSNSTTAGGTTTDQPTTGGSTGTTVRSAPASGNGTTTQTSVPHSSHGVSDGTAAGLAVGLFFLGALLALLLAFFLLRKRNKRSPGPSDDPTDSYNEYPMAEQKGGAYISSNGSSPRATGAAAIIDNHLPQAKDDNTLINGFSQLRSKIDNHVSTFYQMKGGDTSIVANALAKTLGTSQSSVPPPQVLALLNDPRQRSLVLRSAIAWIIMERISRDSDPTKSFLPKDIVGAYAKFTYPYNRLDGEARPAFLSKWRAMTAAMTSTLHGPENLALEDDVRASIRNALQEANTFLQPLENKLDTDSRLRNLEAIMERAARLGWTLFSQPSEYAADWKNTGGAGLVVFPGLMQVTDAEGKPLRPPRDLGKLKEYVVQP